MDRDEFVERYTYGDFIESKTRRFRCLVKNWIDFFGGEVKASETRSFCRLIGVPMTLNNGYLECVTWFC